MKTMNGFVNAMLPGQLTRICGWPIQLEDSFTNFIFIEIGIDDNKTPSMKLRGRIDLDLNAPKIWDRIIFTEQELDRCWRRNPTARFHRTYPPTESGSEDDERKSSI